MVEHAKVFEYAVELDQSGTASVPGGSSLRPPEDWTADHLLLTALVRCSIDSFTYHARRAGSEVQAAGSASGRVTRRESDGRFAFVEIACRINVVLDPPAQDQAALIEKAERDCFVGASLTVRPQYEWHVA
jgi:organic hydroperoxide reductase OsmC/OhrA